MSLQHSTEHPMAAYLGSLFEPNDNICIWRIRPSADPKKDSDNNWSFMPRETAADFRMSLALQKDQQDGWNIYIAMNPFKPEVTTGRTKENVATIRTVYTDIDKDGPAQIAALRTAVANQEVPEPHYILNSSPGKYQVIWCVEGFDQSTAESTNKALIARFGGDSAAKDITRVLRIPGFMNLKYAEKPVVKIVGKFEGPRYSPADFTNINPTNTALSTTTGTTPQERAKVLVPHGAIHPWMVSRAGELREVGLELEDLEPILLREVHENCEPPIDDEKVKQAARSVCKYPAGAGAADVAYVGSTLIQPASVDLPIEDAQINPDEEMYDTGINIDSFDGLPLRALASTRLQDIYGEWFVSPFGGYEWPLAFALPALVTAASVLVPPSPLVIDDLTHLYTGLIGPFGCGKSQILEWACRAVGIHSSPGHYYEIKFGSAEQLMKEMSTQQKNKRFDSTKACLINPDEWADMLVKAGIQDSGFPTFLTTAFNRRQHAKSVGGQGGGKTFRLDLGMSIAGGIIEDAFGDVFGASTLGGLYDRFLFGRAPKGFKWSYINCPIPDRQYFAEWNLQPVSVDPSVYEVTKDWARQVPELGRVSEVCIRVAKIYACLDGRPEVFGKDMEPLKALALYQKAVRQRFRPNPGQNPDALYANEVMDWINQHAKEWTSVAKLKQRNWRLERKYGPTVADRALLSLARSGRIDLWLPGPDVSLPTDYRGPNVKFKKGLVRRVK